MFTFSITKLIIGASVMSVLHSFPFIIPETFYKYFKSSIETPEELEKHVKIIARAIGLKHPNNLHVFINADMNSVSFGTTYLPGGAWIGLPRQILWKDTDDIKYSHIAFKDKPVDWESDYGLRLARCMLQSASQINFRIGHELSHIHHFHSMFHVIFTPFTLFTFYLCLKFSSEVLIRFGSTPTYGLFISVLFTAASYLQGSKYANHYFEYKADEYSADLGIGFAKGGIEMLQKSRKLAVLMGTDEDEETTTHPSSKDRIKRLQEYIRENYSQLVTKDSLLNEAFQYK